MRIVGRVTLMALVVAGSMGVAAGSAVRAQDPREVTFAFWGDPAEEDAYTEVIDTFSETVPGIEVDASYTPGQGDYQTKISTDFASGNPPDVFLINYRRFGQYAARGALEPLGPRLRASETLREEEFYPIVLDAFRYRGEELTCIPQNVSSLVVYFNQALFEAAGVPLPAPGWTWDDFVAAAKALTVDQDGDGETDQHGLGVEPSMIRYAPFIWAAGGEIVDNPDNPTKLTIDTPEAIAGIQWFMDLGIQNHNVVPMEAEVLAEDDESRFMNGTTAMLLQSRRVVPTLREIDDFTWDVAPLPVGPAGQVGILHSDAFCMAAEAEDKEAAWAFIEYAVGPQGQKILAETGRTVPSLRSVAESPAFLGADLLPGVEAPGAAPASSEVFLETIPQIRRVPSISTWPEVEEAFNTAFQRAFYEEIDLEGAIDVAQNRSEEAFRRASEEELVEQG
ncbi:MAG: sugar ABC transporter substrate-binding protein [Chloroflexota bacterium]|nr:sugar ABC transporter substrate-binding protein [Chloroflexota bacterium]